MFTRVPSDYQPERRRPLGLILGFVGLVYLVLTGAGTLWTDFLWFDSIDFREVWLRNWGMTILLGAIGVVATFVVIWGALSLVDRISPRWAPFDLSEEEELVERFREWVEPRLRQFRFMVTGGVALLLGLSVATWRDDYFLFRDGGSFGATDPIFGVDLGFYVFRLPFWENLVDWVFNLMVLMIIVVAVNLYLNGGIRFDGRRLSTTRGAKIYLSVLLAVTAIVRAFAYRLDMFDILYANRNAPTWAGPGFADINSRLPAIQLLMIVALIAAGLFILNIFRRGWALTLVTLGSWVLVAALAGSVYPAFVQRFQVLPNQLSLETEFIAHNMEATKAAWLIDEVEVREFPASDDLDADAIAANENVVDNLRIWNTSVLPRTYKNFQELEPYYALDRVDTDRYTADGSLSQVMVAVRELEEGAVPPDWQNQRLFYTHGFGAVVNQANVVQPDGQPDFLLKDVPPVASVESLELLEPRVYFGETYDPGRPVIVRTGSEPQEIDIPLAEGTGFNEYSGEAGVVLDNLAKRIAFAFRYRDLNLLISSQIRPDSRVLVERNVMEIVDQVAPFLASDADPYPVILDGRVLWVLDLYTTSGWYPYAQPVDLDGFDRLGVTTGIRRGMNYVRNSVKAVIDANEGDVTLYQVDTDDPIINSWVDTHPGMFTPASEMPDGLEGHLRYPQDLFRIQSQIYLRYHVNQESQLFSGPDDWSFPGDPSDVVRADAEQLWGEQRVRSEPFEDQILPYYLLTELPGEEQLSYLLLQPFNPKAKRNMVAFLVADSTPGSYGRLIDFRMPQGELVDGAEQAGQRIEQDAEISQQLSLWRGDGSSVTKGDILVVPIETSVIYIQPIFLEEEDGAFPEFRRVAVVYSDRVEWSDTLDGALELVFGAESSPDPGGPEPGESDATLEELVEAAEQAFANAETALRSGDLANYQRWVGEAQRLLNEIADLVNPPPNAQGAGPL